MKRKFSMVIVVLFILCLTLFLGCTGSGHGIEGSWILSEEIESNGKHINAKRLGRYGNIRGIRNYRKRSELYVYCTRNAKAD